MMMICLISFLEKQVRKIIVKIFQMVNEVTVYSQSYSLR